MGVRQTPNTNHNDPAADPAASLDPADLLRAAAELSRKLQWAIGTTWLNSTGNRGNKRHIDSMSTRYAAAIITELHQMASQPPP